ncbi:non-LTR retroelement reverse transcriptase-like protein [Trifolium pratense]|uniref:Non-LTR retroelement reverse transcriptase-like protein n=1 Tax=Trifolium pratense TaxID=57577 RepID=A0A2K3MAY0_TRIPR|nr:non-LTR retroelement reverse transcriptase-like protein [Trifolium pratense]
MLYLSSKLRQEYGSLGVRRLREFNLTLLGKWCWRMLVDRRGCGLECCQLHMGWMKGDCEMVGGGGLCGGAQSSDRWQWQPDPDSGYTVRDTYQFMTTLDSVTLNDADHLIWHPQVPLHIWLWGGRIGSSLIHILQHF